MLEFAMFPGQGSQSAGMALEVLAEFPNTKSVFEEASEATGLDLVRLCSSAPLDELTATAVQQPTILTMSVAIWAVLETETDWQPSVVAGHSLGEYSALVASKRLKLSDAARLVRLRGQAMQEAVPAGEGAMAAVMRIEADAIQDICSSISGTVEIANYNGSGQTILSGAKEAVAAACEKISALKGRAVELPVSAPFHSTMMKPAQAVMAPLIQETEFADSSIPIVTNVDGVWQQDYDKQALIDQIVSPVQWTKTLSSIEGNVRAVEVGPGKVLSGIAKRNLPEGSVLVTTQALKEAIATLNS